ncbi:MAG TPA: amidohydrolase family protein [Polyangiaceae bacterium]|nr:amidohydrolase family protein [Polyangiaceae bacterium]
MRTVLGAWLVVLSVSFGVACGDDDDGGAPKAGSSQGGSGGTSGRAGSGGSGTGGSGTGGSSQGAGGSGTNGAAGSGGSGGAAGSGGDAGNAGNDSGGAGGAGGDAGGGGTGGSDTGGSGGTGGDGTGGSGTGGSGTGGSGTGGSGTGGSGTGGDGGSGTGGSGTGGSGTGGSGTGGSGTGGSGTGGSGTGGSGTGGSGTGGSGTGGSGTGGSGTGGSGTGGSGTGGSGTGGSGTGGTGGLPPLPLPPPPDVVACGTTLEPAPAGRVCGVVAGAGPVRVLRGNVVAPENVYVGGEVVVGGDGVIACVGCDCSAVLGYAQATRVTCAEGTITPALINTHDHITFAQNAPKPHAVKYDHRHEWRTGANGKPQINVPAGNGADTVAWGELRFVLGGAASTVGSGGVKGMLRNLDRSLDQQEGLNQKQVRFETFPLNDANGALLTQCTYNNPDTTEQVALEDAYLPHIAEGVSAPAQNEFACTKGFGSAQADYLQEPTALIHGIGLKATDAALMGAEGVGLIWSPRSNLDLYGVTANVVGFAYQGVPIALGTDWSASGSYNLLRELACADSYNQNNLGGAFQPYHLYRMVTEDAAALTASGDKIGSLKPGLFGDITVWSAAGGVEPFRSVVQANVQGVALVLRAGLALYGEPEAVDALSPSAGVGCEALDVCGAPHKVCAQREFGKTLATLQASIAGAPGGAYPLFFCNAAQANEPSCVPSRPGEFTGVPSADDADGDGIANAQDLCPTVFSARRPMDGAAQADGDGDGLGDACDPCPFKPGTFDCPLVSQDVDADGVPEPADNCPDVPNPDQTDADADAKGDLCDACPNDENPGSDPCPPPQVTITQAKGLPNGTAVLIKGVVVSAVDTTGSTRGFWVQDAFAGLFAFSGPIAPTALPGDVVDLAGTVGEFSGLKQLTNPVATKVGSAAPPAPFVVSAASIATGGPEVAKYMSVLVRVENVSVTNQNPDAPVDFDELAVTGNLRVDDFIFDYDNASFPVGTAFAQITGPLHFSFGNSKILPRSAADLTPSP